MANAFDQFDSPTQALPQSNGNAFDQFDSPIVASMPNSKPEDETSFVQNPTWEKFGKAALGALKDVGDNIESSVTVPGAIMRGLGNKMAGVPLSPDEKEFDWKTDTIPMLAPLLGGPEGAAAAGEGLINTAEALPGAFAKAAAAPLNGAKTMARGWNAMTPQELQDAAATMKSSGGDVFNQMRELGIGFSPEKLDSIKTAVNKAVEDPAFIPEMNPKTLGIVNKINQMADSGDLDLGAAHQYRTLLSRIGGSEDGVSAGVVRKALSNQIIGSTPDDLLGEYGPQGIALFNRGNAEYARGSRFEDVSDILQKANGDPTKIKNMLNNFVSDKDNLGGFTTDEISALRRAANTTVPEHMMKMLGKAGISLFPTNSAGNGVLPYVMAAGDVGAKGATAALVPGGVPLVAAGTAARAAQTLLARGKAQQALDLIGSRELPPMPNFTPAPKPLQLESPSIKVPPGGFAPPETAPQLQRLLPSAGYDPFSPENITKLPPPPNGGAINVPPGGFRNVYDPTNLNVNSDSSAAGISRPSPIGEDPQTYLYRKINGNFSNAVNEYNSISDTRGGKILNTDSARELSPHYMQDRTLSSDVHDPASSFVKRLYQQKLGEPPQNGESPTVLFTAGGTGSGKSSAIKSTLGDMADKAQIVYDTNMNTLDSAKEKINDALAAGKDVKVAYVYRDPVDALVNGALPRATRQEAKFGTGRTVPLQEHFNTHVGSLNTIKQLNEAYKDNPNVQITAINNSLANGNAFVTSLDNLPKINQSGLKIALRKALDNEYQQGKISTKTYQGFLKDEPNSGISEGLGTEIGGQPQPQRQSGNADELTSSPDFQFLQQMGGVPRSFGGRSPTPSEWAAMLYKTRRKGQNYTAKDRTDPHTVEKVRRAIA